MSTITFTPLEQKTLKEVAESRLHAATALIQLNMINKEDSVHNEQEKRLEIWESIVRKLS
jgi:hypothetical protein